MMEADAGTILTVTVAAIAALAMLPKLIRAGGRSLRVGDRIRLSGGYSVPAPWLGDKSFVDGVVIARLAEGPRAGQTIVELTRTLRTKRGASANTAALSLRYRKARWRRHETVHVELLPTGVGDLTQPANKENWVESHASYKRL